MRPLLLLLLLLAPPAIAGEEVDGEIKGGKARKLVDEGRGLIEQADAIFRPWFLDQIPEDAIEAEAVRMADLYGNGCDLLSEALELQYDSGVNHLLTVTVRRLQKVKMWLFLREQRRRAPPKPPEPTPTPTAPATEPSEEPPREPPEEASPPPSRAFAEGEPPATPVDASLTAYAPPAGDGDTVRRKLRDEAAIRQLLRNYCDARRANNLLFKHVPCGGKGKAPDGGPCPECAGSGVQLNLHHFRRGFWTCFSPLLRDTPGALEAIRAFHVRAQRDPAALGALVKAFEVGAIEHHDLWARALLKEQTTAGKSERWVTVVPVGSRWYFYAAGADDELLPAQGGS
ncbi:MAG: hypothetical protein ACT4PV_07235 [Planctomycetaceae bacterium]